MPFANANTDTFVIEDGWWQGADHTKLSARRARLEAKCRDEILSLPGTLGISLELSKSAVKQRYLPHTANHSMHVM